jgi:hypothetical protein
MPAKHRHCEPAVVDSSLARQSDAAVGAACCGRCQASHFKSRGGCGTCESGRTRSRGRRRKASQTSNDGGKAAIGRRRVADDGGSGREPALFIHVDVVVESQDSEIAA